MTVFQSIQIYESKYKFTFNQRGRNNVGLLVKQRWRRQYPDARVAMTESIEPEGCFFVANYPDFFTEQLHAIVKEYVKFIIEKPRLKKKSAATPTSYTSNATPPAKVRKRKPIQKPAFSGKRLQKDA